MGNELLCSKHQEIVPDFQFNTPEQNINSKIEESLNDQDELNIIEAIKTNKTNRFFPPKAKKFQTHYKRLDSKRQTRNLHLTGNTRNR